MVKHFLRRALYLCGGIAFALIAAEALVYVGYWVVRGKKLPQEEYRSAMLRRVDTLGVSGRAAKTSAGQYVVTGFPEVIHPYLGFVPDPGQGPDQTTVGDAKQILQGSNTRLIVAVFGGSFAAGLCHFAGGELRRVLARPGTEVHLLCMAVGGYKQPQQLLALAYLLALGAHLDILINVDGFNEVALPAVENIPQGVSPVYPRGWFWRVGNLNDPEALELLGGLFAVDRERSRWADVFSSWGLYRSTLLALVWEQWDRRLDVERRKIRDELNQHKIQQAKSYASTGPTMTFADERSLYDYLGGVWKDSSLQMKLLCEANGIAYHHFLQPNQYVDGSKPMGSDERKVAIRPGHVYQRGVVHGYPVLIQEGKALRGAGVKFHDLTTVFADVRDPLYNDDCCHVSGVGYRMIARVIGDAIRTDTPSRPADQ